MRNLKLTLAYDGTRYHGWQLQPGVPTLQEELEQCLARILDQTVTTHASGRTDAGVHAMGQVVNFEAETAIEISAVHRGVNALLPPDIRVFSVEEVPLDFHARRSARSKTYEYRLWRSTVVSPFQVRYVHPLRQRLNPEAMDQATEHIVGSHDFTSFTARTATVRSAVREIYDAGWDRTPEQWIFRVRADGFLQYMVRTIVGTLIEVGRDRIRPDDIVSILEARDRRQAGPTAPAKGLHLISVDY